MTTDFATLTLLPGLGSDSRIYAPQRSLPMQLKCIDWIEPESPRESLAHYAERMAGQIKDCRECLIGGISLGAMVALEAARHLDTHGILLIGGCRSHRQISPLFRGLLAAVAATPPRWITRSLALSPLAFRLFERLSKDQRQLMSRMLRDHSPAHIRWSCRAILEWEYSSLQSAPIHAIHGQNDEVIPPRSLAVQELIPAGRHLINLDHSPEVNRFLIRHAARH